MNATTKSVLTELTHETLQTLISNIRRYLSVAGGAEAIDCGLIGDPPVTKLTQAQLVESAGIKLPTLAKILNGETTNPTLESICQLAGGLNISPALLLMSTKDWKLLLAGVDRLMQLAQAPDRQDYLRSAQKVADDPAPNPKEVAEAALALGREFLNNAERSRQILEMYKFSAMADMNALEPVQKLIVLVLASVFGYRAPSTQYHSTEQQIKD
ncbi:helix-turn-helix domain-containing protein [Ferrovum myxofaciens]|uniref:helix-turn-helix domain-containing protein n=1 Tax=Ferrovum myxofaciens TaxID=416213 RepID=UPI000691BF89|nr:helix-turn-helix domain-containing protein [Ferrovum myxofaciens]